MPLSAFLVSIFVGWRLNQLIPDAEFSGLSDDILRHRPLAPFALHDLVEGGEIGALTPLQKKRSSVHGRELFGHCGCYKLIEASAVCPGTPHDFGFD
jgi:hypothetical protein